MIVGRVGKCLSSAGAIIVCVGKRIAAATRLSLEQKNGVQVHLGLKEKKIQI